MRVRRVKRKSSPFSKLCISNCQSLHNVRYFKTLQIQNHSYRRHLSLHFSPLFCLLHLTLAACSLKEIDMNFLRGEECLRLVLVHFSFVESHVVRGGPPLDPHRRTGRQFCALGPEAGGLLLDYYCAQEKVAIGNRATGREPNIWTSWR